MSATSRKDRKRRSRTHEDKRHAPAAEDDADKASEKEKEITKYLEEKQRTLAVIASGYGPGDDERQRQWRRRRKLLLRATVAVAVLGIAYGVAMQYRPDLFGRTIEADSQHTGSGSDVTSTRTVSDNTASDSHVSTSTRTTDRVLVENASAVGVIASRWARSEEYLARGQEGTEAPSSANLPDHKVFRGEKVQCTPFLQALDYMKGMFRLRKTGTVEGIGETFESSDKKDGVLRKAARLSRAAVDATRMAILDATHVGILDKFM